MAVVWEKAGEGIIITASHNPKQWNALKLLNNKGEFISSKDGKDVLRLAEDGNIEFAQIDKLGSYSKSDKYLDKHIQAILALPYVDAEAIKANFKILVDAVNSWEVLQFLLYLKHWVLSKLLLCTASRQVFFS